MDITFEQEFLKKMFNRYWRDYPWFMQLIQFALMIFIFMGFAAVVIGYVIPRAAGIPVDAVTTVSENSPMHVIHGVLLAQFVGSLLLILIPAFLFAYATHPNPAAYLGLITPKKTSQLFWVALMMLGIIPLLLTIPEWLQQIDFGKTAERAQAENDRMMKALLKMNNFGDFAMTFATLAILPALGEEMMFRGVIMKMAAKRSRSIGMPLFITAILFAWVHSNVYGMPSIFIAGFLLGIIYYLTSSLWCSVLAHLINNGLQIFLIYLFGNDETTKKMMVDNSIPWYFTVGGMVLFIVAFLMLWKNRTPLPKTWANDFTNEELDAIANSQNNTEE